MSKVCYVSLKDMINNLPVQTLSNLCGISKQYCYILLKTHTKLEIFNMYCELVD